MSSSTEESEFRCFVGGLSWSTTDRGLEDAFRPYSSVLDAKVMVDRDTGRSRGFGFVTFGDERSMDEAIHRLHGKDLDGRPITVNKAQPKSRGGSDRHGAGSRGGGECFKCGQPGHWARECHSGGGGGAGSGFRYSRGGGGGDRYGSGWKSDRFGVDHYRSGYGGSRSSGLDRYTGSDRYGTSESYRNGDGYTGKDSWRSSSSYRSCDSGRGDRYSSGGGQSRSARSGPYDRPSRAGASSYDDRN